MNKIAALFVLPLVFFLGGCASTGNTPPQAQIQIPIVGPITYSSSDLAADVARDVAQQFPRLSHFHQYPQTVTTSIGDIHRTGVIVTVEGNKVHLEYLNYRMIMPGANSSEVATSTLCDLIIRPVEGMPGKFTITSSPLSERIGHSLLLIPFKPLAPIDKIASDIENTLLQLRQTDVARDFARLRQDAIGGDANAQTTLALWYHEGKYVPKDYAEAVKWSRKAAEQNYALAQYNLGLFYETGQGVLKNTVEAVKWYRSAAEQGQTAAMINLGGLYSNGDGGLTQDYAQAYKWWILAKASSNPGSDIYNNASRNMSNFSGRIAPSQIARAQQEASLWEAAHSGAH